MIIRKAKISDLDNIMIMYKSCVDGMIKSGVTQWDATYPNKEIITKDIQSKTYFIAIERSKIIGGVNIDKNQDNIYLTIDWKDKKNKFLVVHRLAIDNKFWKNGIGRLLMNHAEKLVKSNNLESIRLDTYSGNPQAVLFYKRLGYNRLGSINLKPNMQEYYCYEKIIR